MELELDKIKKDFTDKLKSASNLENLREIEVAFLGRKGKLATILKSIKDLPADQKKEIGKRANELKNKFVDLYDQKIAELGINKNISQNNAQSSDVTLPGLKPEPGSLHPLTSLRYDLDDAFLSLGFEVYDGPEITSEAYAFDNLNFPPDHPARESMDTYWLAGTENKTGQDKLCLRPHLTGGSIRYMQTHKPPFRFVYPGRVFRSEATDASHERAFYQYEALIVDKQVPFSAGRVMVEAVLERVFGKKVKTRMRAGFFPFVEPGFEIDMQCLVCSGKGCSVCSHTGWVEMMPGGPPHPNVFKAGGIDSETWQGFYINIGLDRLVMMKYGIDDIRLFHSGDLRFLRQFR